MEFSSFNTYRSFKKHEKVIYIAHSNTIYPWFPSKTKPKLVILHREGVARPLFRARGDLLSSLIYWAGGTSVCPKAVCVCVDRHCPSSGL